MRFDDSGQLRAINPEKGQVLKILKCFIVSKFNGFNHFSGFLAFVLVKKKLNFYIVIDF